MKVWPFFRYFFSYILRAKTRQRLLFIAVVGLFLSAFSLMVIQGIMGGLQKGLIARSKSIHGSHLIIFDEPTSESLAPIKDILIKEGIHFYSELETEVMLKSKNFVAPAKLHGIDLDDEKPEFLQDKDFKGLVMGSELAGKIHLQFLDEVQIIAPGVTDSIMGEVPRFVTETLSDYLYTELSEVDEFEIWSRVGMVQNLLRAPGVNQIRLFGNVPDDVLEKVLAVPTQVEKRHLSWEKMNEALVWSLNLETKVMLFLFISMSLLVAIAITSGLMIFYSKIRRDLMSFWILGMAQKQLVGLCFKFTLILSALTVVIGGIFGYITLKLLEKFGHDLMPDIFVERQLPVQLDFSHIVMSLVIPFGISLIFSYFSFAHFRKENQSFVAIVRSLG
ncbi:ABC transporter permease [Peredibacter starrii]|uniref:FtsX-like permease family protein n=1 Tax=Peredibacter starrii TaxID=28202 RepID=A0AAX4HK88_9BACT|nr:FtsX-like permease family protein [Peredibacter starrii]WPU63642.1 FtsX-like permease family protein [Peredibacter starrii]